MSNLHLRQAREAGEKKFCPMMQDWCIKGWTKAMGTDENGMPQPGVCAAWQPIPVFMKEEPVNVHGCVQFDWKADLVIAQDATMAKVQASVDKVATEVAQGRQMVFAALPPELQERALALAQMRPLSITKNNGDT